LDILPKYEGEKFSNGTLIKVEDAILSEEALQININELAFSVIMRTPANDFDLVRGLLYCEDIYTSNKDLDVKVIKTNALGYITEVNVSIEKALLGQGYLSSRSLLSVSSCGICGKRELGDLRVKGERLKKYLFSQLLISKMQKKMIDNQQMFKKSGGSHAAAAFNKKGDLLLIREDVGRHNAVDKVVGGLFDLSNKKAAFLLVSGRVSYEIVTKVFRAKIPVLIAVSAPSSLAVDYAKELGISLYAFCREGKSTRYS
jgi:FdhD protein